MLDRRLLLQLMAASLLARPVAADARVTELLGRMTLAEKLGQLTMLSANFTATGPVVVDDVMARVREGRAGSLFNLWGREAVRAAQRVAVEETRLGIPLFFGFDIVHGHRTIFPIPLGEAATFDPALWEATARSAAAEAAAEGVDLTFAPMLDIARDPRWGRIAEGPGEDPFVGSRFATAKVAGFQHGPATGLAATAKHFVAYGASAAGRDYAPVEVSPRTLAEVYLPPFQAAVEAGVAAIMPAFTDIEGVPLTGHRALLAGLLRETWGFRGIVVSDYGAIGELVRHGAAADPAEAAALALAAGVDIDMMSLAYERGLPEALARELATEAAMDAAVLRVLGFKAALGLLDDPYRRCTGPDPETSGDRAARRTLARRAGAEAMVVLQDPAGLLPLPPGRLALIGPLADAAGEMIGPWHAAGVAAEAVGVAAALGLTASGGTDTAAGIAEAVTAAAAAEIVILCIGETARMSGEAASRARIDLPEGQAELAAAVLAVGKPTVVLLFSGRPIAMPEIFASGATVIACWFPGSEAGRAVADVLSGRVGPSGRLPVTWPRHVGQVPIGFSVRSGGRPENPNDPYTSHYLDLPNSPQFAFGHGVAPTRFTLGPPAISVGERVSVEADLANAGDRPGVATVFLFLRDPVATVPRPVLELKAFERVALAPGERRRLRWELSRADLAYPGPDLAPLVEPGEFEIHIGFSAAPQDLRSGRFRLE